MDEWIILVVIFILIAVISTTSQAKRNRKIQESLKKSESYRKSQKILIGKSVVALCSFIFLMVISFIAIAYDELFFGLILLASSIIMPIIILFTGKEEGKKIQKMYQKQENEEIYQEELIKEKARLQARREHKNKK